jgi:Zn-dependent protease with chaperone function
MKRHISLLTVPALLSTLTLAGALPLRGEKRAGLEKVELEGYAEWRRDGSLIVDGERVRPDAGMTFVGHGAARTFESIPLGYEVAVEGTRGSDGSVLAKRVEARLNGTAFFENDVVASFDELERSWRESGYVVEDPDQPHTRLGRLIESGPEVERVREVARRLLPPYADPEGYRVYVVDNETWNAMAGPNGSVFVFRGLLEDLDDDELAIVLGHEIAHATHEHSRRAFKRSFFLELLLDGGLSAIDGAMERGTRRQVASIGAMLAAMAWQNRYSRQQEDQADRVGLRYAYEGGFDVFKAPELWRKFAKKYGSTKGVLGFFFADHSSSLDRARKLERELELNYRRGRDAGR